MANSLLDFVMSLVRDPDAAAHYAADPTQAIADANLTDVTSADVNHGVKVKELNLSIKANKGQTSEVPFTPTQVGTFVGQCSVFCGSGHGQMKMTFHVTE